MFIPNNNRRWILRFWINLLISLLIFFNVLHTFTLFFFFFFAFHNPSVRLLTFFCCFRPSTSCYSFRIAIYFHFSCSNGSLKSSCIRNSKKVNLFPNKSYAISHATTLLDCHSNRWRSIFARRLLADICLIWLIRLVFRSDFISCFMFWCSYRRSRLQPRLPQQITVPSTSRYWTQKKI